MEKKKIEKINTYLKLMGTVGEQREKYIKKPYVREGKNTLKYI